MFEKEPEDILGETVPTGAQRQPGPPYTPQAPSPLPPSPKAGGAPSARRTILVIGAGVVVLVAIAASFAYQLVFKKTAPETQAPASPASAPSASPETGEPSSPSQGVPSTPSQQVVDSDKDGLTDSEEQMLGTDPLKTDTDNDGLSDFEEARVWNTNPVNPDTDGDGFSDGQEVTSGYNPNGAGKLQTAPSGPAPAAPSSFGY